MRILDNQRYWSFFKAYVICFVALVGLYIVIDAFSNLDEFGKRADGPLELFQIMGRFYLVHMTQFYDRLCGVIGMMAAIFTVTWMQRNNELLAMLAAGVSTQRVIRPVWVATIIVSMCAMLNQEFLIPRFAEELQHSHDDDGSRKILVSSRYDPDGILIHGQSADRASRTLFPCNITLPLHVYGTIFEIEARQARYIPTTDKDSPLRGGWLLRGVRISPRPSDDLLEDGPLSHLENTQGFPRPYGEARRFNGDAYFLASTLSFDAIARSREWYMYATTPELIQSLSDPSNDRTERMEIGVFLHSRLLRPLSSLTLMLLSLPLVLGGYGRNMFINLGLSLGTSAIFYGVLFLTQYLGGHDVISPELSAWTPLIGFGTIAVARWGTIRT